MFENLDIEKNCAEKLEAAVKSSRLSHAVILEGSTEGTRLKVAKELAAGILCSQSDKPCKTCRNCKKVLTDCHPDVHYLIKDEKSALIKVDEIRALKQKANLYPNDGNCSVFIISEAQNMGVQAQNALLKIFEEPAAHVKFILTCDSKSSFLDTIISRGSIYSLSGTQKSENGKNEEKAFETIQTLVNCLCYKNEYEFLKVTGIFQKDKELFECVLENLIPVFADSAVISCGCEVESSHKKFSQDLSMCFTQMKLLEYVSTTRTLLDSVHANANHNLLITKLCSSFYTIKNK